MASRTVSIVLTGTNASAIRAIEGTSAAAAKAGGVVDSKLGGAAQKVGGAFTKLDSSLAGFGLPFAGALGVIGAKLEQTETKTKSFGGSLASVGGAELVAGAAGLALVGGEALKMADAFDQAHAKLETSVHNVGQSLSTESGKIKEADDKLTNLGFKSSDTEAALARLVPAVGSVGKATELLAVAADLARFKNESLGDATQTLINIEAGRLKGLGAIIGSTKDATGKTLDTATALQRLRDVVSGQGSAYLDTYAGKLALAGAKSEELGVKLGELEKVAIGGVVDKTLTVANGFQTVNTALDGVPGKILAIGAAFPVAVFAGEKLIALGTKIGGVLEKAGKVAGIVTPAETVGAGTAATVSNTAAAASADALAASNAAVTASFVGMSGAELATAAATGTISAEELAVVVATQELNAALAGVAATSDLDAVAIERLTAANVALATAEHEAAIAAGERATAGGAAAGAAGAAGAGEEVGAAGLGLGGLTAAGGLPLAVAALGELATAFGDINIQKRANEFGLLGTAAGGAAKGIASIIPGGREALGLFGLLTGSGDKHADTQHKIADAATQTGGAFYKETSAVDALAKGFDALEGKTGALAKANELSTIADKFDAVNTAQAKVAADKADLTGTSKNAHDADRAEADAVRGLRDANQSVSDSHQRLTDSYASLRDAQDRVKTSAHSLLEAQQALDEFNSPRGARERTLQQDIIQRRVASSPIEQDQKQLDLLNLQDTNANKQQSLTDAVASAQKGLVDANRGVEQAQRGIAEAERGIGDATQRVADAQQGVSDAVARRKAVHDDAAKAIVADERAVTTAVKSVGDELKAAHDAGLIANDQLANYLTLLKGVADIADPGGVLTKNLDSLIGAMQLSAVLAQKIKDDAAKGSGPTSFGNGSSGPSPTAPAAPAAPTSPVTPVGPGGPSGYPVRAEGGPVAAHTPYKVGEVGPELFVPKTDTVASKAALAASVPYTPAVAGAPGLAGAAGHAVAAPGLPGASGRPGLPGSAAASSSGSPGASASSEASATAAPGAPGHAATPGKPGPAGVPGAPAHISVAAHAALNGKSAPHPDKTAPIVVGVDGPHIFVPPVAGTIVPNDKLAVTAAGKNPDLKGYATGGRVEKEQPIVVGEKGPEIFVPQSAGAIVSNAKVASTPQNATYASSTSTASSQSAVVQNVTNQFPKAVSAVEKFSTVIALAATKTDEAQKATDGYAKAQTVRKVERATRAAKASPTAPAPSPHAASATTPATVVTNSTSSFTKELANTASSLKTFDTELVTFKPFVPLARPSTPSAPVPSGSPQPQGAPHVTFANTYHINAHGNPTKTEIEAIAREQTWRLLQSGRR